MSEGGAAGHAERVTQAERDERSRQRRAEVLALPMTRSACTGISTNLATI